MRLCLLSLLSFLLLLHILHILLVQAYLITLTSLSLLTAYLRFPFLNVSFELGSLSPLCLLKAPRLLDHTPNLTVALSSSAGRQGNGVLHGSAQAGESTVTIAKASSVDVELGVLGGEGGCGQGVGGVSQGRRFPQTPFTTGRLVQRDLLVLEEGTGQERLFFSKCCTGWITLQLREMCLLF